MAVLQATSMLDVPASSLASQLPHDRIPALIFSGL
jgi:hypothetical protein